MTAPAPVGTAGGSALKMVDAYIVRSAALLGFLLLIVLFVVFGVEGLPLQVVLGVELAVIAAMFVVKRRYEPLMDRWLQGAVGERKVGKIVDGLVDRGWYPIHDVSLDRGNIDHILVGTGGIFTIETKSHRGRIGVGQIDERMLKQAYAQRCQVERITGYRAEALLVFSDGYLVGKVPAQVRGVVVLPARMLAGYLERRPRAVTPERAARLHSQLAAAFSA